jgi:hypothetical protein
MEDSIIEDLEVLDQLKDSGNESDTDDCIQKPKKPRSEKQILAFQKVLDTRNKNREDRKLLREKEMEKEKEETEAKIMKKAISIKKKQIKKQLVLDDISDDDEPIEAIKQKIIKSEKKKAVTQTPVPAVRPPLIYM